MPNTTTFAPFARSCKALIIVSVYSFLIPPPSLRVNSIIDNHLLDKGQFFLHSLYTFQVFIVLSTLQLAVLPFAYILSALAVKPVAHPVIKSTLIIKESCPEAVITLFLHKCPFSLGATLNFDCPIQISMSSIRS